MSDERIEGILADFRTWLRALPSEPAPAPSADPVSLHTLAAQFSALRHDVNMQTKAARAAIELSNAAMHRLRAEAEPDEPVDDRIDLKPVVKMVLDLHDALSIARGQLERAARAPDAPVPVPSGFFGRLFAAPSKQLRVDTKLREQLAGAADGYAMSLRRIERAFADLELEPIAALGEPFDPDCMEAVDTAPAGDVAPGSVVEVLRGGYRRSGRLVRHAQVKVAK
jgi:molecular chaperone GrpE